MNNCVLKNFAALFFNFVKKMQQKFYKGANLWVYKTIC